MNLIREIWQTSSLGPLAKVIVLLGLPVCIAMTLAGGAMRCPSGGGARGINGALRRAATAGEPCKCADCSGCPTSYILQMDLLPGDTCLACSDGVSFFKWIDTSVLKKQLCINNFDASCIYQTFDVQCIESVDACSFSCAGTCSDISTNLAAEMRINGATATLEVFFTTGATSVHLFVGTGTVVDCNTPIVFTFTGPTNTCDDGTPAHRTILTSGGTVTAIPSRCRDAAPGTPVDNGTCSRCSAGPKGYLIQFDDIEIDTSCLDCSGLGGGWSAGVSSTFGGGYDVNNNTNDCEFENLGPDTWPGVNYYSDAGCTTLIQNIPGINIVVFKSVEGYIEITAYAVNDGVIFHAIYATDCTDLDCGKIVTLANDSTWSCNPDGTRNYGRKGTCTLTPYWV